MQTEMKKIFYLIFIGSVALLISSVNIEKAHSNNAGAQAGYTGSPNENNSRTCASQNGGCHGGTGSGKNGNFWAPKAGANRANRANHAHIPEPTY